MATEETTYRTLCKTSIDSSNSQESVYSVAQDDPDNPSSMDVNMQNPKSQDSDVVYVYVKDEPGQMGDVYITDVSSSSDHFDDHNKTSSNDKGDIYDDGNNLSEVQNQISEQENIENPNNVAYLDEFTISGETTLDVDGNNQNILSTIYGDNAENNPDDPDAVPDNLYPQVILEQQEVAIETNIRPEKLTKYKVSLNPRLPKNVRGVNKQYKCNSCGNVFSKISVLHEHKRIAHNEKPYSCDLCNYSSFLKKYVLNHKANIHGMKPYKCELCDYRATHKSLLHRHATTHDAETSFKCTDCSFISSSKLEFISHLKVHNKEKPFKCNLCDYLTTSKISLHRHLNTHSSPNFLKCDLCGATVDSMERLFLHEKVHRLQNDYKNNKYIKINVKNKETKLNVIKKNNVQEKVIVENLEDDQIIVESLEDDQVIVENLKGELVQNDFNYYNNVNIENNENEDTKSDNNNVKKKKYVRRTRVFCDYCGHVCTSKWALEIHLRVHTGEKPYKCSYCGIAFRQISHKRRHEKSNHTNGEKDIRCDICYKKLEYDQIDAHMETHNNDYYYVCGICNEKCNRVEILEEHITQHSEENSNCKRPYHCSLCTGSYKRPIFLKQHIKAHLGEKEHECRYCSYQCVFKGDLNLHMKIHDNILDCKICGKIFFREGILKRHMSIHSGDQAYKCSLCDFTFNNKGYLTRHMKTVH